MSTLEIFKDMPEMNHEYIRGGFIQRPAPRCMVCKVTLSKWTLPENDKQSPVCKNCSSTAPGGVFYLTKEGEKLEKKNETENNQDGSSNLSRAFR